MSNRIALIRSWLVVLLALSAAAGCGDTGNSSPNLPATHWGAAALRNELPDTSGLEVLRVREDPIRNRLWVLMLKEVRIYNTATTGKRLLQRIPLPLWSVVGFRNVCMPDMALDRGGSAYISSNGQARLLRIDTDRFAMEDYVLSFHERDGMDVGFGALTFAADGTLFARTTPGGLLWKIDLAKASATATDVIKKLPADQCTIAPRSFTTLLLNDIERG